MPDVDARILRLQQGAVTVVLLAGFVFQIPWLIPVAAVLPGLDAALGSDGPDRPRSGGPVARRRRRSGPARQALGARGRSALRASVRCAVLRASLRRRAPLLLPRRTSAALATDPRRILVARRQRRRPATGLVLLGAELGPSAPRRQYGRRSVIARRSVGWRRADRPRRG